jgi:hypothetical protein
VLKFSILAFATVLLIVLVIPWFGSAGRGEPEWYSRFWFQSQLIGPILCALFHRSHREFFPTYNGGYTRCQKCGVRE